MALQPHATQPLAVSTAFDHAGAARAAAAAALQADPQGGELQQAAPPRRRRRVRPPRLTPARPHAALPTPRPSPLATPQPSYELGSAPPPHMPPKSAEYPCLVLSERAARHLPSKGLSGSKVLSIRASSFHGGGRYDPKLWKERNLDFFSLCSSRRCRSRPSGAPAASSSSRSRRLRSLCSFVQTKPNVRSTGRCVK